MRSYTVKRGENSLVAQLHASHQCRRIHIVFPTPFSGRDDTMSRMKWLQRHGRPELSDRRRNERNEDAFMGTHKRLNEMLDAFELHTDSRSAAVSVSECGPAYGYGLWLRMRAHCIEHTLPRVPLVRFVANVMRWTILVFNFFSLSTVFLWHNRNERLNNKDLCSVFLSRRWQERVFFCFWFRFFVFHNSTYCVFYTVELWLFDCKISGNLFSFFSRSLRVRCCFWFAIIIWMRIDCIYAVRGTPQASSVALLRFPCLTITRNTQIK